MSSSVNGSSSRALLVVDLQNDFCEGGILGVAGGEEVAKRVSEHLRIAREDYEIVVASKDWHALDSDNGGHFAKRGEYPDFRTTWPPHCLEGSVGAEYHPYFSQENVTHHIRKGWGSPGYSMFDGMDVGGQSLRALLNAANVLSVDVVGIATDFCVRATALDGIREGLSVSLIPECMAAVDPATGELAIAEMLKAGATLA